VPIKLWSSMITGMGAVATPVEVSELATALATGLVVGQENPLPNIYTLKLYEVQKYVMMTNHMQSVLAVFINEKAYQGIPASHRGPVDQPRAARGARDHAACANHDARHLQRADGRGGGARALLPHLPLVHRGVVRDRAGWADPDGGVSGAHCAEAALDPAA